jgi:hypothetical protein
MQYQRVLPDMPMQAYHRTPGLSSSGLSYAAESMAKYRCYLDGGLKFESRSLDLGSAVHLMLESSDRFYEAYQVRPEGIDKRTKAGKEAFAELESNGKIVLDQDQWATVHTLQESFENSDDALIKMVINSEGQNEVSVFWEEEGMTMKCRPDRIIRPSQEDCEMLCRRFPSLFDVPFGIQICVDFKTSSRRIDPKGFGYACRDYQYPLKASHYLAGTQADAFLWVVLETVPPYGITRYFLSNQTRQYHDALRLSLIQQIIECEASGVWPGITLTDQETLL